MDLQSNPPIMYSNFEKIIATGGHKEEEDSEVIDKVDTPISEDNKDNL